MGVTYKLKQEVVDYIVAQKRSNPDISCRKLTAAVQEKFQVEVSKSSVNTIFKNANLSSPVGRRSALLGAVKPQKFKIPEAKKSEILIDSKLLEGLISEKISGPSGQTVAEPVKSSPLPKEDAPQYSEAPPLSLPSTNTFDQKDIRISDLPKEPIEKIPEENKKVEPIAEISGDGKEATRTFDQKDEKILDVKIPDEKEVAQGPLLIQALPENVPSPIVEKIITEPPQIKEIPPTIAEEPPAEKSAPAFPQAVLREAAEKISHIAPLNEPKLDGPIYDGMGSFFLKAAQWEVSSSSLMGSLLNRYALQGSSVNMNVLGEVLLYMEAFGITKPQDVGAYHQNGLWAVNNIEQRPAVERLEDLMKNIPQVKSFCAATANLYTQLFSEIGFFKITFNDKTNICFDAQGQSVWPDDKIPSVFASPMNKALHSLSNQFISNGEAIILREIPGQNNFSKHFYDALAAFENLPEKKIERITVYTPRKEEIAKFTTVPLKKRQWIAGMWPWQEECKKFIEANKDQIRPFYHEGLRREFYYTDMRTKLPQATIGQNIVVRAVFIRESPDAWPVVGVLTNIADERIPSVYIASCYLSRWPNLQEGHKDFSAKSQDAALSVANVVPAHDRVPLLSGDGHYQLLGDAASTQMSWQFLLSALNNYCQRHFFPAHYEAIDFSNIRRRFYTLEGCLTRHLDTKTVTLKTPQNYEYQKDLEYAVKQVNEHDIRDYAGQRLVMRIEEQPFSQIGKKT